MFGKPAAWHRIASLSARNPTYRTIFFATRLVRCTATCSLWPRSGRSGADLIRASTRFSKTTCRFQKNALSYDRADFPKNTVRDPARPAILCIAARGALAAASATAQSERAAERAQNLPRSISSISDVGRSAALLCSGVAEASMAAAGQKIACRYPLAERGSGGVRHEKVERTALCRRPAGHQTARNHSKYEQEASHGSLLEGSDSRTILIICYCDKYSGARRASRDRIAGASDNRVPQKDHADSRQLQAVRP